MKILFIGARLFEDVAPYTRNLGINSILTESNPESPNLKLADSYHIVSRGMDEPIKIAIKEEVDGVVPLIGIDEPLVQVAIMKEQLEADYGIPVIASGISAASTCADKFKTKEFFVENQIKTPKFFKISKKNYQDFLPKMDGQMPIVLKQAKGQGGSGIKITSSIKDMENYINKFESTIAERFIEGSEVSIEVLRWKGKSVPLVPVYKGETTVEGIHPLKKIKKAPLEIEGINNSKNNRSIQEIAVKIAENIGLEGTADIDIIYDYENNENNVIEVNARPSGTRYITWAATGINIMHELVNMASGKWNALKIKKRIKDYIGVEIPVGNYNSLNNIKIVQDFSDEKPWIIHGPENHQRITIRGSSIGNVVKTAEELEIWE
jgi:carbamoylphosphate synthase large subunit